MSVSVEFDGRLVGRGNCANASVNDIWNVHGTWRDSSVEARLSPHHVNLVESTSSSKTADSHRVTAHVAAQLSGSHRAEVDRMKRLSSFSVADILGPRYGSSSHHHHHHHHHHQQQQQHHGGDDYNDDAESTSTRSNEDMSSSLLSHDSSVDGPSTTGSDRDHRWTETERRLSTSRKLAYT